MSSVNIYASENRYKAKQAFSSGFECAVSPRCRQDSALKHTSWTCTIL